MTEPYAPERLLAAIRATAKDPDLAAQLGGYTEITDPNDSFVWLIAGIGEIQYYTSGDMAGQAWFLTWDRTHAVDHEEELVIPEGLTVEEAGLWLVSEARKRDEATI